MSTNAWRVIGRLTAGGLRGLAEAGVDGDATTLQGLQLGLGAEIIGYKDIIEIVDSYRSF